MFMVKRELSYYKGRIALLAGVVALLSILTGFLSGLTGGLAQQNINGVLALSENNIVVQKDAKTLTDSTITEKEVKNLPQGEPLGISMGNATTENGKKEGVAIFARENAPKGKLALSRKSLENLGAKPGDSVMLMGQRFTLESASDGEKYYGHAPIATINIEAWRKMQQATMGTSPYATVLLTNNNDIYNENFIMESKVGALPLVGSFRSEIGSLALIIGMLLGISSVVMGCFIYTWNKQRERDFAIVKALGGGNGELFKGSLLQSSIILLLGLGAGSLVVGILGWLISTTLVPYVFSPYTLLIPGALLFLAGILGTLFSLNTIRKSDPAKALEA